MRKRWIHFTEDADNFNLAKNAGDFISKEYGGIFVYPFSKNFPVEERSAEWEYRKAIILECEEDLIKLIQTDPIGDDRTRDEYVIPIGVFNQVKWWRL